MTVLAETPPPLKRLFERLDFAVQPKHEALVHLLSHWADKRSDAIAPRPEDIALSRIEEDEGPVAFAYRVADRTRDFTLMTGPRAIGALLGPCEPGSGLRRSAHPRVAVRLRRLFETVCRTGEPVLAEFILAEAGRDAALVEILAAPLSDDGLTVDAILGGVSVRPIAEPGYRQFVRQARRAGPRQVVFALGATRDLGLQIAQALGVSLAELEERSFEDGEHKTRPLVSVRGREVSVIQSLYGEAGDSPNDKLCRLLFFIGALKDSAAARVTAVVPYLCYGRKDRQTKTRDPITTRYVAQLFEAVGTDRVITMEAHNVAAYQNAFRCGSDHLDANALFASYLLPEIGDRPVAVVSPDLGGAKRAERFREMMEAMIGRSVSKGFMDKRRSMGQVTGEIFAGDVAGCSVIIIDDLISTGTTMARVAAACGNHGAERIYVAATHGLFTGGADALWREPAIDRVIVTNTTRLVPLDAANVRGRLVVLDAAKVFAGALERDPDDDPVGDQPDLRAPRVVQGLH
ncbi:MAG TPA: ribose-phosphate diphosphokinase [Microvirga sp.]|nr:ribose-phosphate diphosphokinase [Microvirga sp.]